MPKYVVSQLAKDRGYGPGDGHSLMRRDHALPGGESELSQDYEFTHEGGWMLPLAEADEEFFKDYPNGEVKIVEMDEEKAEEAMIRAKRRR